MAAEVPQTLEYKGGQLNVAPVLEDFQDSPDDEEDTRSSQEYMDDLEEEYQARALLAKSKRFFKKGTQRFNNEQLAKLNTTNVAGRHKQELRPTKDFEAKYNKVKAKLALLSSSVAASKASMVKNKWLIAEAYEWDEEKVSSDDNEMVKVKVLMALDDDNVSASKEGARNGEWVKISMRKHVNTEILKENQNLRKELKELTTIIETWLNSSNKVNQCISELIPTQKKRILGVDQLTEDPSSSRHKDLLSEVEGFILPNHDTGRILLAELQRNTTDPPVAVTDSSATDYDSADESLVCSTPLPPLEKLAGVEPVSGPQTIKSILKLKFTFKAEALKSVIINEPSSAPAKDNKCASALKINSAPNRKLKNVKTKDDPLLTIVMKEPNELKLQISRNQSSYSRNNKSQQYERIYHRTCDHAEYMSTMNMSQHLKGLGGSSSRSKTPRPSKHFFPLCIHLKPIWYLDSGWSRHMTGVKSYLHKYAEQPGPKVVFGDDSACTTEGYGSVKLRDVYVLNMTSSAEETCFFAKASENLNWLLHKRLAHLNFKTINKLAKQNLVIGLPSLAYSKDKPCSSCEKGKHHRASFKTKQTSSIKKCVHLLHINLFELVTPRSINHEKYTLVIVDDTQGTTGVFNTRRPQTEETYHITFDESPDAIKFTKPSVDNINIAESERYPPDEYLHSYEPSQRYQTNNNDVSFIEPYESPKLVVLEAESKHTYHNNDDPIIDNLINTEDVQNPEPNSTLVKDTSVPNTIPISIVPSSSIIYYLSSSSRQMVSEQTY
ncbi:retrovirus-related pol polyprotein from transposon TNT 1-94 [Tanacetum coccineum]|uniref:Retrovirus-related pol polyprotein from transposon TNT 1-94 n=1 Tax=Tanacetum coccineum TaxID=301880 RepID=A0ABQ5AJH8_9ASTR